MGSRMNTFFGDKAKANYSANRAEFKQAQQQYQSKSKFGKTATRLGGLSQDEIGAAPTMKFSKGFLGDAERSQALGSNYQGMSLKERRLDEQERKRAGLGFGSSSQLG